MAQPQLRAIDESKVQAAGIRKLTSHHLTFYTDLPADPAVDELPAVFDQAFPQWCAYFGIDPEKHADWHVRCSLMKDKTRFEECGLLPAKMPDFAGRGYTRRDEFWVYEPTSPYYRRHQILHEGTHSFCYTLKGDIGPPWYAEGVADMLATHRWQDGRLQLNIFPARSADVFKLERVEIVQHDVAAGQILRLTDVLAYGPRAHRKIEPYGWSWALAAFLDGHPRYRERFRRLPEKLGDPDFNRRVVEILGDEGAHAAEEFQVYVNDLAYNYDFKRTALDFTPGKPLAAAGATATVAADHGWQNSGLRLEAGKTYKLTSTGRYQLAKKPRIWWSEPGGVSIRYLHGHPLGILLAAVRPDEGEPPATTPLVEPIVVGTGTMLKPEKSGTLFLRINNSPGELDEASGSLSVSVSSS